MKIQRNFRWHRIKKVLGEMLRKLLSEKRCFNCGIASKKENLEIVQINHRLKHLKEAKSTSLAPLSVYIDIQNVLLLTTVSKRKPLRLDVIKLKINY